MHGCGLVALTNAEAVEYLDAWAETSAA